MSTKIHALVDALGNPLRFLLTPGQTHDLAGADALLSQMEAEVLIADKAYDADARVLTPLANAGKSAVVNIERRPATSMRRALPDTSPDRKFLLQAQTVPWHRHATIRPRGISSPLSTSPPLQSGLFDDRP